MASSKEPPPAGIGALASIGGSPVAAEKDNLRRKPTQQLLAPGPPSGKARFRADVHAARFPPRSQPRALPTFRRLHQLHSQL